MAGFDRSLHWDTDLLRRQPPTRQGAARHSAPGKRNLAPNVRASPGPHRRDRQYLPFSSSREGERGRDVTFRGLAVPGSFPAVAAGEDLVAVWRMSEGRRFQNYRATFTILDDESVSRAWIGDVLAGSPLTGNCPATWRRWASSGHVTPLITERIEIRTPKEQRPRDGPVEGSSRRSMATSKRIPTRSNLVPWRSGV